MTFEKVREIVLETLSCDGSDIKPETNLTTELGADSLDAVELSMALEDAFSISIPDEDLANFKTVGDIVAYIDNNK